MFDLFKRQNKTTHLATLADVGTNLTQSDHYAHYLKSISVSEFTPKASTEKDALLLPLHAHLQIPASLMMEHAVYDNALNPITYATHIKPLYRGFKLHPDLPKYPGYDLSEYEALPGRSYYGGILLDQFGHFILETLTRFWRAVETEERKFDQVLFHVLSDRNTMHMRKRLFRDFWSNYFHALGITEDNFIFIEKPFIAEELIIPQCSVSIGMFNRSNCYISEKAHGVWSILNQRMAGEYRPSDTSTARPEKIYMSRRNVNYSFRTGQIENEADIEHLFRSRGFHIIRPEELSSENEKHYLLSECKILAGPIGSGMHNSVFMKPGGHILSIISEQMNEGVCALEHLLALGASLGHNMYQYYQCDLDPEQESKDSVINLTQLSQALDHFLERST